MTIPKKTVLIVGGGIGGLTCAILLAKLGWRVKVFEQADTFSEIGAGIQISPNGMTVLKKLDLINSLKPYQFLPSALQMCDGQSAKLLVNSPVNQSINGHHNYINIHRADLIACLFNKAKELGCQLHTNSRVLNYRIEGSKVLLFLQSAQSFTGDLVVASDGLNSTIRNQMLGLSDDCQKISQYKSWRGSFENTSNSVVDLPSTACVWSGKNKHIVTTKIRAGKVVNVVIVVNNSLALKNTVDKKDLLALFENWHSDIKKVINAVDSFTAWSLTTMFALPKWSDRQVVLLGDSAHCMYPSFAQGGTQAIEDAWVLAHHIQRNNDLSRVGENYYRDRVKRVSKVQLSSIKNIKLFHQQGIINKILVKILLPFITKINFNLIAYKNNWLYRYNICKKFPIKDG